MHTQTVNSGQRTAGEKPVTVAPTGWNRIRPIAFWFATVVILLELFAGSAWNLFTIDWVEAQLDHLGYPDYIAYVLGATHVAAAVAITVPGFPLLKELRRALPGRRRLR